MDENDLRVESARPGPEITAPDVPYLPPEPRTYNPPVGLIGCGGVASYHLAAYAEAGFKVVALCDVDPAKARDRRDTFYPDADVYTDYTALLARDDIEVVDIATHVDIRPAMIDAALASGKHVLSQKPFVDDLDEGIRLADLADRRGLKLAVNQNGRWAPHFSYIRHAAAQGVIGDVTAVHMAVHWDHSFTAGTVFDAIPHLILYDFGIHWFDMLTCIMGAASPDRVYASVARARGQKNKVPMLGQVSVAYPNAQASLVFDGVTPFGALDTTYVAGARGTLVSSGPDLGHQSVTLYTADGCARPALEGEWFTNGFRGAMSELLCAVEEGREPENSARNNLKSLALCFAALAAADDGEPKIPGSARRPAGTRSCGP